MTAGQGVGGPKQQGRWDPLITELHTLRETAGTPSYDTLTRKLIEQRMAEGQDSHAARIAKSSVHDAFRFGRSRINESLVRELVRVMGGNEDAVATWVAACEQETPNVWTPPRSPDPVAPPPEIVVPTPTIRQQVFLAVACVLLNLLNREFVDFFRLPIYLDMMGTAIAAFALGPWRGAAVGLATSTLGVVGSGWISLPLGLVSITGALLWGYGVRRWGMGSTLPRFFVLNVITAVACSVVAVPILIMVLGDSLRPGHDVITQLVEETFDSFYVAIGFSNLLTTLGDKIISGFIALVVVSALPLAFRARSQLILVADK